MSKSVLPALLFVLSLSAAWQALACAPGETQICLGGCICVPDPNGVLGPMQERARTMSAQALEGWILRSRNSAAREDALPIPAAMRSQLLAFYPAELLDSVRYKIGDNDEMSAARNLLQNPDIQAVTLIDIIVFRSAALAERDVALWAHELLHVQQYREWGSAGFAARYSRDYRAVEAPAYRRQAEVSRILRERQGR